MHRPTNRLSRIKLYQDSWKDLQVILALTLVKSINNHDVRFICVIDISFESGIV